MNRTCITCGAYKPDAATDDNLGTTIQGECHARPPQVLLVPQVAFNDERGVHEVAGFLGESAWPRTAADEWCREWASKDPTNGLEGYTVDAMVEPSESAEPIEPRFIRNEGLKDVARLEELIRPAFVFRGYAGRTIEIADFNEATNEIQIGIRFDEQVTAPTVYCWLNRDIFHVPIDVSPEVFARAFPNMQRLVWSMISDTVRQCPRVHPEAML